MLAHLDCCLYASANSFLGEVGFCCVQVLLSNYSPKSATAGYRACANQQALVGHDCFRFVRLGPARSYPVTLPKSIQNNIRCVCFRLVSSICTEA